MGNSVIYRPAYDAEVEYLKSDGNSYIDTGLKASSELGILAHIYVIGAFPFGGRNGLNNKEFSFCARQQGGNSGFRFGSSGVIVQGERVNELYEFDNTQNHNILKVGNTTYVATYNSFISDYNVFLFGLNTAGVVNFSSSRIYDFKIYQNSTLVRDFIPVRIGQIGYMYDKVSKQLFANKGTGNFILGNDVSNAVIPQQRCVLYFGNQRCVVFERIYEEYEWLIGDGTAYIDVQGYSRNENWEIVTKLRQRNIGTWVFLYGVGMVGNSYDDGVWTTFGGTAAERVAVRVSNGTTHRDYYLYNISENQEIQVIDNHSSVVFNGNVISVTDTPNRTYKQCNEFYIFSQYYTNRDTPLRIADADFSDFIVNESGINILNLIPCRLLRPIPATLDGNGIARQAGECGMWDKVSNRFYGNVASSGTFTVKGPKCYEEYKWLNCYTTDGATLPAQGADIGITPISLTNKVLTIELGQISRNVIIYGTSPYFIPMWCMYGNNMYVMYVQERKGNDNIIHRMSYNWTTPNTITLDFINNVATLGNSTFKIEGTGYTFRGFNSVIWQNPRTVGRIKISDELDLVPCKLTHGIPASMDANGIARPAGTCGMWDKVNDVFYGNVANSGSFTVSND